MVILEAFAAMGVFFHTLQLRLTCIGLWKDCILAEFTLDELFQVGLFDQTSRPTTSQL